MTATVEATYSWWCSDCLEGVTDFTDRDSAQLDAWEHDREQHGKADR